MREREAVAWLLRRAGWGPVPGQLDELTPLGPLGVVDWLVDPDGAGLPAAPDPWAGHTFVYERPASSKAEEAVVVRMWLTAMLTTPRPLVERMRFLWHGHLVTAMPEVKSVALMVRHLQLLGDLGLGSAWNLLRAICTDAAMLRYLDGTTNRVGKVNENFGRELLELFALGRGAFTEADVRAAAVALTGWVVDADTGEVHFDPARHDDTPQQLLGVPGIHGVDGVAFVVATRPAFARHLVDVVCAELAGDVDEGTRALLAQRFASGGLDLRELVRDVLTAALLGRGSDVVAAPLPWLVRSLRACEVPAATAVNVGPVLTDLQATGHWPLHAPNVAGWPGGRAWLTAGPTLARQNLASQVAMLAPGGAAVLQAVGARDHDLLADLLGHPEGYGRSTADGVHAAASHSGPRAGLAVALAAPEMVVD